ncbi:MAG: DeoR family transcriptional regulator [Spirochaetales bacterium]
MKTDERRSLILKKIEMQGSVLVKDIVSDFRVSDMTIRRDLDELEKTNLIRRKYGKAVSVRGTSFEPPYQMRKLEHSEEKAKIGMGLPHSLILSMM